MTDATPFDPEISIYRNVRDNTGTTLPLSSAVEIIKGDQLTAQTTAIRDAVLNGDRDEADRLKKDLPGVTFSGTFSRRAKDGLDLKSPFLVLDFDGILDHSFESMQRKTTAAPFVVLAFVSPSGNGLKIVIRIGDAEYSKAFRAACRWAVDVLGIEPDPSGKDVSRLCFLCSDPDVFYNSAATVFPVDEYAEPDPKPREIAQERASRPISKDEAAQIFVRAQRYLAATPPAVSGQHGHDQFFSATNAIVHGFDLGDSYETEVLLAEYNQRCEPPFSASEVRHKIESAIENPPDKSCGWLLNDKPSNSPLIEKIKAAAIRNRQDADAEPAPLAITTARQLIADNPELRPVLIDGLLRQGETLELIAAPKVGKSHLVGMLSNAAATGRDWLGRKVTKCRVLIIDNELHRETIAGRLRKLATHTGDFSSLDGIDVLPLRGGLLGIDELARRIPTGYGLIILDSFYRFLAAGKTIVDENDNSAMTDTFNLIDRLAMRSDAGIILIHHTSKGVQGSKKVTDVGSGAGSQSRAADSFVVIREHEAEDCFVLDAVVRSFPPPCPIVIEKDYPVFRVRDDLNPTLLAGRSPAQRRQATGGRDARSILRLIPESGSEITKTELIQRAMNAGYTRTDSREMVQELVDAGEIVERRERSNSPVMVRRPETIDCPPAVERSNGLAIARR